MAKDNEVKVGLKVDDNGSLKEVGNEATKTGKKLKKGVTNQAHSADRAMKGLSNQSSNATKNFSKMSQGLAGGIVPIYATLAAQVFALSAAFQFLKQAADFRMLIEGQRAFGLATGVAYQALTKGIIAATDAQVTYSDAAQAAAIGTAAGLNPQQLMDLADAAKKVSIALGRDITDSFNRLIRGATKAEPELLDELGIILRLDPALKKYAASLGKSKDALTAYQKTQAVTNEILEQAERKYAALEMVLSPTTNQLNKAAKSFDDIRNSLNLVIAGPVERMAAFFAQNVGSFVAVVTLLALSIISQLVPSMKSWRATLIENRNEHRRLADDAVLDLQRYRSELAAVQLQAKGGWAGGMSQLKGKAGGLDPASYGAGTGMAILAGGGSVSKRQLGALKGQLKRGVGPFKDMGIDTRKEWQKTFDMMDKNAKKTGMSFKNLTKEARLLGTIGATKAASGWSKVTSVFSTLGIWLSRIIGFATKIGLVLMVGKIAWDAYKAWKDTDEEVSRATAGMEDYLKMQQDINKELWEMAGASDAVMKSGYMAYVAQAGGAIVTGDPLGAIDRYNTARTSSKAANKSLEDSEREARLRQQRSKAQGGLLGTVMSWFSGAHDTARDQKLTDVKVDADTEFAVAKTTVIDTLKAIGEFDVRFKKYIDIFEDGGELTKTQREQLERLYAVYAAGKAATNGLIDSENQLLEARAKWASMKGTSLDQVYAAQVGVSKDRTNIYKVMEEQGLNASGKQIEGDEMEAARKSMELSLEKEADFKAIIDEYDSNAVLKGEKLLAMEQLKNSIIGGTKYGEKRRTLLRIDQSTIATNDLINKQKEHALKLDETRDEGQQNAYDRETARLEHVIALQREKTQGLKNSIDPLKQIESASVEAFETGMANAIVGVLDGTKSMKEGFLDMSKAVLQAIAQIIAKLIAMKAIQAMGFGFADGGIIPMANGGVMNRKIPGYNKGGVVTHPTYLVGEGQYNEAVVPLPDGRSIPVQMVGNSGGTANVVVNVSSDGETTSNMSANGGEQAAQLGRAISAAVQEELHKQQRNGGILSPYGNPGG